MIDVNIIRFAVLEHGSDERTAHVRVSIVDDQDDCAGYAECLYDLTHADGSVLECFDPATLALQCASALDSFMRQLMISGVGREDALGARNSVILTGGLRDGWPDWDCMTDAQRHLVLCASMDVADPRE